jgi:hypothetical protein
MRRQPGPRAPEPVRYRRPHARRGRVGEGDDAAGQGTKEEGWPRAFPARTPAARNAGLSSSTRATQKQALSMTCPAFRAPGHCPLSQVESHTLTAQVSTLLAARLTSGTRTGR